MNWLQRTALALVIIGAINWGLIGFFNFDLVATIFGGQQSLLSRIIYSLVGLSGLYALTIYFIDLASHNREMDARSDVPNYGMEFSDELDVARRENLNKREDR